MKEVSKSINPVKHVEVDRLEQVHSALASKHDFKPEQKQVFDAVKTILQKFRENQEKDLTQRNIYLVNFIIGNFQEELKPYIDDFSKTVGLQEIIKEEVQKLNLTSEQNKQYIQEIFDDLKTSIRQIKVEKSKTDIKTPEAKVVNDVRIEHDIDSIFESFSKNENVNKELVQKIDDESKKHTSDIVKLYRERCASFSKNSKIANNRPKSVGRFRFLKNVFQKEKKNSSINKKDVIQSVLNPFRKSKTAEKAKNAFTNITKRKNIIESVKKPLRIFRKKENQNNQEDSNQNFPSKNKKWFSIMFIGMLSSFLKRFGEKKKKETKKKMGFLSKMFSLFGVTKLMKGIWSAVKGMGIALTVVAKNTFLAFMMTPDGMYAIGYVLGYVYGKIRKLYRNTIGQYVDKAKEKVIEWIESPSVIGQDMSRLFHSIVDPITQFITYIKDPIVNLVNSIISFPKDHPILFGLVVGLIPFLKWITTGKQLLSVAKMAGDPLAAIIATGIFGSALAIKNIWKSRHSNNYELMDSKVKAIDSIKGANQSIVDILGKVDREKYELMFNKINREQTSLEGLVDSIDQLQKNIGESESNYNLALEVPDLVDNVFHSDFIPVDDRNRKFFEKNAPKWSNKEQIDYLAKMVNIRFDKLTALKGSLSQVKSSKELEQKLKNLGTININTGEVQFSEQATQAFSDVQNLNGKMFDDNKEGVESGTNLERLNDFSFKLVDKDLQKKDTYTHTTYQSAGMYGYTQTSTYEKNSVKGTALQELKETDREQYNDVEISMMEYSAHKNGKVFDSKTTMNILREKVDVLKMKQMDDKQKESYFEDLIKEAEEKRREQEQVYEHENKNREKQEKEALMNDIGDLEKSIENLNDIIEKNGGGEDNG